MAKSEKKSSTQWYDEFHVRILKKPVRNPYTNTTESVIVGWELVKKLHPKLIEPSVALHLNSFAEGFLVDQVGKYLVAKDTMTTGQIIPYKEWADQYGKNPKEDINQLLA